MRIRPLSLLILVILLFTACAAMQTQNTPKKQAAAWLTIYNQVYDDTLSMALNPKSTPAQKAMVVKKKAIMVKLWPLLKSYIAIIDAGSAPSNTDTMQITELINQLTILGGE